MVFVFASHYLTQKLVLGSEVKPKNCTKSQTGPNHLTYLVCTSKIENCCVPVRWSEPMKKFSSNLARFQSYFLCVCACCVGVLAFVFLVLLLGLNKDIWWQVSSPVTCAPFQDFDQRLGVRGTADEGAACANCVGRLASGVSGGCCERESTHGLTLHTLTSHLKILITIWLPAIMMIWCWKLPSRDRWQRHGRQQQSFCARFTSWTPFSIAHHDSSRRTSLEKLNSCVFWVALSTNGCLVKFWSTQPFDSRLTFWTSGTRKSRPRQGVVPREKWAC